MSVITVDDVVGNAKFNSYHLRVMVLCGLLMISDGYDLVSFGTVITHLMDEWSMSAVTAGILGSMALVGMFFGGLFVSPLADRHGRRKVIIGCLTVASIASFACSFAHDPTAMGALRFAVGVALGGLVPNFIAMTSEFAPRKSKALMVTVVTSLYSVGGVAAALLAIYIEPILTWRGVFYVAGTSIFLVPVILRFLPESPAFLALKGDRVRLEQVLRRIDPTREPDTVSSTPRRAAEDSRASQLVTGGNGLNSILIWLFFAMCMLLSYGLNTWLPKLMQQAGYELGAGLWTLVILNAGGLVGAISGGWIADRWTFRGTLVTYFSLASLSLFGLSFNPGPALLNMLMFIAGAATIGVLSIIHAFAVEYYPVHIRTTGVGWAAGMGRCGAIAGPSLGGALVAMSLPFQQNFIIFAAPGVIGAIAVALVARRKYRDRIHQTATPDPVPSPATL